jgi:hypothetical protein
VTCNAGTLDCNDNPTDGCEVQPLSDSANCGTCGHVCPYGAACGGGSCSCGTVYGETVEACGGNCVDVSRDPTNCGGCNTRCTPNSNYQSTNCVASACRYSYRSTPSSYGVNSIAIDDTYVYYADYLGIHRVTKASHGETPFSIFSGTGVFGVAVDATTIYWTDANGVFSCPIAGCVGSPKALSDVPSSESRLVIDDTNFYFSLSTFDGIDKCPKTGCQDAPTRMSTVDVIYMAPSPSSLFAITETSPSSLLSISLSDPPVSSVLIASVDPGGGVAYHAGNLYWEDGVSVLTCDPTACAPKALASMPSYYYAGPLIADDSAVVWAADGIHETILATGVDTLIANMSNGASQLAMDATNVYWGGGDGVYWAPR